MTSAKSTFAELLSSFRDDATSVTLEVLTEAFFSENQASDQCINADKLTELVSELCDRDYSAKSIRANLRKRAYRDQSIMKNATWRISSETALSEVKHYLRVA